MKKDSAHLCLVLKTNVLLLLYEVEQKFGKFIAFSTKTTIHNSQYYMSSINL